MSNLLNLKKRENNSQELYVGIIPDLKVVAVNPTKEELMSLLNTENINEPNYMNNGKLRLDFWIQNKEINMLRKISFWLENKVRVAQSGNTQFINEKNQTCWAESMNDIANKPGLAWFDLASAREAKIGEDKLYDFIVSYIDADTSEGGIVLGSLENIMNGNVEELTKLFAHYEDRGIKMLAGVKEGRQSFYMEYFMRNSSTRTTALRKKLEDRPFDATYILDGYKQYSIGMDVSTSTSTEGEKETNTEGSLF